ncbi:Uncharacterized protein rab5if [Chamberlinius hualienensis]
MGPKTKNQTNKSTESVLARAFKAGSTWPDKDEFLDVIYWLRQLLGVILGILWGIAPLKGFLAIALFCLINAGVVYVYCSSYQKIDDEEFGGIWEITKEGFMTSFAGFMVTWIIFYAGINFE